MPFMVGKRDAREPRDPNRLPGAPPQDPLAEKFAGQPPSGPLTPFTPLPVEEGGGEPPPPPAPPVLPGAPPPPAGGAPGGGAPNGTMGPAAENPFLEPGVVGEEPATFARPGSRAFQPFAGRVIGRNLRQPGTGSDAAARALFEQGGAGRVSPLGGGGGGTVGDVLGDEQGGGQQNALAILLQQMGLR